MVAGLTVTFAIALFKAARWTASTDGRLDALEAIANEIHEDIKKIFHLLPTPAVEGKNPIKLTDFGKKISETAASAGWAKPHAPNLVGAAKGKPEFEVYEICVDHVDKMFNQNDEFNVAVRADRPRPTNAEPTKTMS